MLLAPNLTHFGAVLSAEMCTAEGLKGTALVDALNRYKVVVARNCRLTVDELLEIAESLGKPSQHTLQGFHEPGYPTVMLLSNVRKNGMPIGVADAGQVWHSDSSFLPQPPAYTLLHSIEVPDKGGETLFIDMHSRYECLPRALSTIITAKDGIFSYKPSYEAKRKRNPDRRALTPEENAMLKEVSHRLIQKHPRTGQYALYVNQAHAIGIDGIPQKEGLEILSALFHHCYRYGPDYIHKWRANDVLIWDNRSVIHRATPYCMQQTRYIRRISIQ